MNNFCRVRAALTLRDVSAGRGESTSIGEGVVVLHPPDFQCGPERFVLFVHGYNVSQEKARESYARFRWWLELFDTPANVIELHWPGDRKWGRLAGACYPVKIETAKRCGVLLADWLAKQPAGAQFVVVGHSLGCRLVLEAVAELRKTGHLGRVSKVCLMAAAVPITHIAPHLLGPQADDSTWWRILYSRGDWILKWTFPVGQITESMFPGAVGATGQPAVRWTLAGDAWELCQEEDSARQFYGHGYYWQGGPTEPVAEERCHWKRWLRDIEAPTKRNHGASARLIAELLGTRTERTLALRNLAPPTILPERVLPEG